MQTTAVTPAPSSSLVRLYAIFVNLLDRLQPVFALAIRLYIARVFMVSGWLKLSRWDSTLALFEQRLTRSFGKGGVWLAGDAAHQAAPIGVHSMNSGLVEARELAVRIARIQRATSAAHAS